MLCRMVNAAARPLHSGRAGGTSTFMILNALSIVIGLFALLLALPAFLPLLGWANWVVVPIAVLGAALGAMSGRTSGRNLCLVVIIVGIGRLMLGGGII
jgi:hypothetical protein